jgi:hypothetical protein
MYRRRRIRLYPAARGLSGRPCIEASRREAAERFDLTQRGDRMRLADRMRLIWRDQVRHCRFDVALHGEYGE